MERQPQKKISYVLPLARDGPAGHRLGVSGLAYDQQRHLLYSGGRDGIIFAWDSGYLSSGAAATEDSTTPSRSASCLAYYQAHTHWINDLTLVRNNEAVISASSDTTIKLWRPFSSNKSPPQILGSHDDYVKAVAAPSQSADWVASGSLDHHIALWDLHEARERHRIRVAEEGSVKGSVYALSAKESLLASGGPENIVRLWDPRSGKRISQLIGHTDNIRSILISDGRTQDTIISASADRTVKIWSITAGRCLYSLAMHSDSVWSLYSDDPDLDVFYSGDRSGLLVKTDAREKQDIDEGFSIGICQENEGINRMVVAHEDIWVATANSSINRWRDAASNSKLQRLEDVKVPQRSWTGRTKASLSSLPPTPPPGGSFPNAETVPLTCVLRLPELPGGLATPFRNRMRQSALARRRTSLASIDTDIGSFTPLRSVPEQSIEGQNGLVKHLVLNNKRHVLTTDSAGEILLWDLLQCVPVKSFGKSHLDVVYKDLNTAETVPQWCEINTRTGTLTCTLDEDHCFSAEVYADELREFNQMKIKDDQRISLGAWILRYLFEDLIHEEVRRDETFRLQIESKKPSKRSQNGNVSATTAETFLDDGDVSSSLTPNASSPQRPTIATTGFMIGAATPGVALPQSSGGNASQARSADGAGPSTKSAEDYFSAKGNPKTSTEQSRDNQPQTPVPAPNNNEAVAGQSEQGNVSSPKESSTSFGKRLKSTFTSKKSSKNLAVADDRKVAQADEKDPNAEQKPNENAVEEGPGLSSMLQVVNEIRIEYAKQAEHSSDLGVKSLLTPALPTEAPVLKPPANTVVIIQEEHARSGGVMDLFEGYRDQLGRHADYIEKVAPRWIGALLLRNVAPGKEVSKIPFLLRPYQQLLPVVTAEEGNERLNANQLLRAKKILGYVLERLSREQLPEGVANTKPEDVLELYCQDQLIPPNLTLITIRTQIFRAGGDVLLFYKPKWRPVSSHSQS